jgi:outer membrane protein assembly factor BamA
MRLRRLVLALALCAAAGAQAQDALPVVREIAFRGNKVTQPRVMLREMSIAVGDPADPVEIERSRQGVQDLGLFRSVAVRQEPVDGGVRLVFVVWEKFYVLPLPRADASSDGGYAYGAQLRWNNVWGLNHTFTPYYERRQPSEGSADPEKRGIQTRGQLRYSAPFIFDSEYSAGLALAYFKTPYLAPIEYEATSRIASLGLSRKLSGGRGSQGWTGSTSLTWQDDSNAGVLAPPAVGHAVSASLGARYRDLHFNVYSDEGTTYGFAVAGASKAVLSDYGFTAAGLSYARYLNLGKTPHQSLNLLANAAARYDGAAGGDAYSIGGVESIRGFAPETKKGDAYYVLSLEYLRPVFRKSIRALVVVDAANAFDAPTDADLDKAYVSGGLGVRVRFQAFVALDLEIGVAWPLNGGAPRLFASKV